LYVVLGKEESSFSEEKEAKRLFLFAVSGWGISPAPSRKSFLVLFFKKEQFLFQSAQSLTDAAAEGKNWIASLRSQ
jgi:hypothetical protein